MQEDFELETVLSVVTGINCTDDFNKVYELFWFMFEDPLINAMGIGVLKDIAKNHILTIHPELINVKFNKNISLQQWLKEQKSIYGESLTISIVGEPVIKLEKQPYISLR